MFPVISVCVNRIRSEPCAYCFVSLCLLLISWADFLSFCLFKYCFVFSPAVVLACVSKQDRGMPNGREGPDGETPHL